MEQEIQVKNRMVLPCLRGVIGDWVYYSSLMTANQITEWISTVKSIRESETLDDYLQRTLKDRKKSIASYILKNESRFFNSIVVGIFDNVPDWIEFDLQKATQIASEESIKNIKDSVGLMVFSGYEKMFAIDGQHRVEGIKIALENDENNIIKDDQYSVLFVAHVDDEKGKKRTRKLFSDINKKAVPVAKGDRILIDEEDISAIVTRRIYRSYSKFKGGEIISLTENAKLEDNDISNFTNLLSIYNVSNILKPLYKRPRSIQNLSEQHIGDLKEIITSFFDWAIEHVDDYKKYFVSNEITLEEARRENKHILFRPIGISLLAKLYLYFSKNNNLEKLNTELQNISFIMPNSIYNKVLWNNGRIEVGGLNLAFLLTLYLLDVPFSGKAKEDLLIKYRKSLKNETINLPEEFI